MEVNLVKRETEAKIKAVPERPLDVALVEVNDTKEKNK
jgi:hypothetical protein